MSGQRDSTCQKNDLPKSLQGAEDAEFVWSLITERFPNAAPLLCEMEAVIDRAEDLLQQLRAPCCREIETSTSFYSPDSEESASMISAGGSMILQNESLENDVSKSVAGTQVSECGMCEGDVDVNEYSRKSMLKESDEGSLSNDSSMMHYSSGGKCSSTEESNSLKADSHFDQRMKEAHSLEEWGKVVDYAMRKSGMGNRFPKGSIDVTGMCSKSEETRVEGRDISEHENSCIILHQQEMGRNVGDSSLDIDSEQNVGSQGFVASKDDCINTSLKGSGDECSAKFVEQRTPLNILETYADRCKVPILYQRENERKSLRYKQNDFVIRGSLGGFAAASRGDSEESAKNGLATKILQMIANQQMCDEKLVTLADLTNEEILEIIELGTDGPKESNQRKLYQLCLQKGLPVPRYTIEKIKTSNGLTYVATCKALGHTVEGRGLRKCGAKRFAAEELYRRYSDDEKSRLQVSVEVRGDTLDP